MALCRRRLWMTRMSVEKPTFDFLDVVSFGCSFFFAANTQSIDCSARLTLPSQFFN